ncbi:unnamed protein product [Closterium sp. NIES-65]|nr:unnamed protein product [Closterium sp. NIES-65]
MVNYPMKPPRIEDGTLCMLGARTHSSCTLHLPPTPPIAPSSLDSRIQCQEQQQQQQNGGLPQPQEHRNQSVLGSGGSTWPVVRSGFSADKGGRQRMEDAHVAVDDLSQAIGDVAVAHPRAFYGSFSLTYPSFNIPPVSSIVPSAHPNRPAPQIFDGHGGDAAAQFARQKLLGHVLRDAAFPLHVGSALRNAFLRTDRELETARTAEGHAMDSGTTALAVLLLGRSLYVANAGDCRAVLCRRGQAVELSRDHRAVCQHERARVERAGGWVVDDYLNDQLAVTRALGDWHIEGLKTRRSSAAAAADSAGSAGAAGAIDAATSGATSGATGAATDVATDTAGGSHAPGSSEADAAVRSASSATCTGPTAAMASLPSPGSDSDSDVIEGPLIADPEVHEAHLSNPEDEFLVLACDGLWDAFNNEGGGSKEVVAFARRRLRLHNDPQQCSKDLVEEAIRRHACDNVTVLTVCFSLDPPPLLQHHELLHSQLPRSFSEGLGAPPRARSAFGADVFRHDLPELPDLDNLFAPESVIAEAQERAARVFGASETRFLVNGSTVGVQAAIVACCRPGDVLILPRNAHQCAFSGMVLSGAVPHYILTVTDNSWGIAHGVTLESVTEALRHVAATGARIGAVLVVSPTYYGVCSDIRGIAQACHEAGAPLIVDEAHGAHFKFHSALPETALDAGADIVVQSTHKVLGSLTQSAMLHIGHGDSGSSVENVGEAALPQSPETPLQSAVPPPSAAAPQPEVPLPPSPRVSPRDVARALQLLQSSSPSYLLLASLDATTGHVARPSFPSALAHALHLATRLRSSLLALNLRVLLSPAQPSRSLKQPERHAGFDPLRVTVSVRELGLTGYEADDVLRLQHGVVAELPFLHGLMFAVSTGSTESDVDRLVAAFAAMVEERGVSECVDGVEWEEGEVKLEEVLFPVAPPTSNGTSVCCPQLPPRDAFFLHSEVVPAQQAVGRYSADMLCPYPPGIPVLLPGEVVTAEALKLLQRVLSLGGSVSGLPSESLDAIRVIG